MLIKFMLFTLYGGWMDGWMDGWIDRWIDRWMDGRIVRLVGEAQNNMVCFTYI